jgi:hypothetical protein
VVRPSLRALAFLLAGLAGACTGLQASTAPEHPVGLVHPDGGPPMRCSYERPTGSHIAEYRCYRLDGTEMEGNELQPFLPRPTGGATR